MPANNKHILLKKTVFYLVLITASVILTIAAGELVVRASKLVGPSTFPFRTFDPVLGVTLIPGAEGVHRRCYDGYVSINRHGMRDKERAIEKPAGTYRIAVFSDSLIEAVHVKPDETATSLLEKRLNSEICDGKCEVLNFSVGGYSPLQYYLRYRRDGRRFDNDLVIVVFTDNDLPVVIPEKASEPGRKIPPSANGGTTVHAVGSHYPSPYLSYSDDSYQIVYPEKPPSTDFLLGLFHNSDLAYLLYKFYNLYLKAPYQWPIIDAAPDWAKHQPAFLFLDPENEVSRNGWRQVEFIFDNFIKAVDEDGAKFLLVHWGYDVDSNPWYKQIPPDANLPATFDPHYASKWFAKYAMKKGIANYNLGADLADYIRSRELPEPYLSFTCDPHFNPEGQSVIADLLYARLLNSDLLSLPKSEKKSKQR
jgi:hypothetical protein